MKLLIRKILSSNISKLMRNTINFRPIPFDLSKLTRNQSLSDAFVWRTDENFKTIFRFPDLLKLFYKIEDSRTEFHFYDNNFNLIKKINFDKIKLYNELVIDKNFLNNYQGFGIFFIFHKKKKLNLNDPIILNNRAYLGFSYKGNLPSFVHGNIHVISENIENEKKITNLVNNAFFMNQKYTIQNNLKNFDKTQLIFVNPTTKKIKFTLNNKKFILDGLCSTLTNLEKTSIVSIKSNCCFLRPIIFNFNKDYMDVYHS